MMCLSSIFFFSSFGQLLFFDPPMLLIELDVLLLATILYVKILGLRIDEDKDKDKNDH